MKFLLDQSERRILEMSRQHQNLVAGQLLTPLTSFGLITDHPFAIDNGGFNRCDLDGFMRIVERSRDYEPRCLFVAVPDVFGSARRTMEVFDVIAKRIVGFPLALVCQDGQEDQPMPWDRISAVFIGGTTPWKMGPHAKAIVRAAQILGKHTHVGRVNSPERFEYFDDMGVDTCDGSGVSRYSHMIDNISEHMAKPKTPLLDRAEEA